MEITALSGSDFDGIQHVAGLEESDADDETSPISSLLISLGAIDFARLESTSNFTFNGEDAEAIVKRLKEGAIKRYAKTLLHDRIVKQLAEKFIAKGAQVFDDPDSIDLFTRWPNGSEAIFEIKTVTRRSLQSRLRSAVGQVEEYAFRYAQTSGTRPEKVIALNSMVAPDAWQKKFLTEQMNIGLICVPTGLYKGYPSASSSNSSLWDEA